MVGFCASSRIGVGSKRRWPDVGSRGVRDLLRPAVTELLHRIRAKPAVREQRHISKSTQLCESVARIPGRQSVSASPHQRQQFRELWWIREHAFQSEIDLLPTMEPEFTETDRSQLAGFGQLCGNQRHPCL